MTEHLVAMEITRLEAAHLTGLIGQFVDLLDDSSTDPAVDRLVPDAYSDDPDAAREFRSLTEAELLDRRREDAAAVRDSLRAAAVVPDEPDDPALLESVEIRLDPAAVRAWLRTLAAIRLVLATRLGITAADDHDDSDPRFGVYDWLGFRLNGLVLAAES